MKLPKLSLIQKTSAIIFLLVAGSLLAAKPAAAQFNQIFTAIPPRLEVAANPGQTVQEVIQFRNEGDSPAYIAAVAKDFLVQDTTGKPEFVTSQVSGRWSAASWMNVAPSSFTVQPKTTADIAVTINVPKDALPGGHYAGVLYQSTGNAPRIGVGTGAGSAIQQVIASLVYVTVAGPITEKAEVRVFEAPNFQEFGPINFTTEIANMSDIHISPQGTITVRNMFGKTVQTFVLNPEKRNIFPGTSFIFKHTWDAKYLLGKYRADLDMTYGSGGTLRATIYFIVFPVRIALAILLAIVIVLLLIVAYKKHGRAQEEAKELEETEKETPKEK